MSTLKRICSVHCLNAFLFAAAAFAQTLPLNAPAPPAPAVSVQTAGTPGFTSYYYVVVAHYPAGTAASQIIGVQNGNATLSGSNYNQVGWQALTGVLTYDVIRLTTPVYTGSCTCSVTTGLSAATTSYSDTGGSLSSYTQTAGAQGATATVYLDNQDYQTPEIRVQTNSNGSLVDNLAQIGSGPNNPAYCRVGDLFVNTTTDRTFAAYAFTGTTCVWVNIAGGGATQAMIAGVGGVVANELVKLSLSYIAPNGPAILPTTGDTATGTVIAISDGVTASAGAYFPAKLAGQITCIFDAGGSVQGDLVGVSSTVAAHCTDLGTQSVLAVPAGTAIIGRVLTAAAASSGGLIFMFPTQTQAVPTLVTCGSTAACPSTVEPLEHTVIGTGTLVSGTPSTYAVTTISPAFTSASTYTCVAQDTTTIANAIGVLAAGYVSGTAVTFTGPNTNTDGFRFKCTGY